MRQIFSLILSITILQITAAQRSVELREATQLAEQNSAAVRKAELDRKSFEKKIREERSAIFPKIEAGVNLDAFPVLPTQLIPGEYINRNEPVVPVRFGQPWQFGMNVLLEQNLYKAAARYGVPTRDAARATLEILQKKTSEEVKFNAAQVFYQTLNTSQLLRSVEANLEKLGKLEKIVALQVKNEYGTPLDLKRVRVARTNLEFQKQNLLAGIAALENTLKFLCGVAENEPFSPVEKIENPAADSTVWLAMIFDAGLVTDLHLIQKNQDLNRLKLNALRSERYPDLKAYAAAGYQSQRTDPNFFDGRGFWFGMVQVGVRLRVPIFDGFRLKNRVAQGEFEWMKLEEDRKQALAGKQLEFSQNYSKYRAALNLLAMQQENVSLAREILEKTLLQHQSGTLALSEVLNAQTSLAEAETNYWQQVFNLQLAKLNLAKSAGRLELIF